MVSPKLGKDLANLLLARSPRFQALLQKSRHSIKAGKGLFHNEIWRAVEKRGPKNAKKHQ